MESPGNKKRKPSHLYAEDTDNEEEKIEKFFAIIRSIQEARDQLMNYGSSVVDTSKEMKKKRRVEEKENSSWMPSFQLEDFMESEKPGGVDGSETRKPGGVSNRGVASPQAVVEKDESQEEVNLSLSL